MEIFFGFAGARANEDFDYIALSLSLSLSLSSNARELERGQTYTLGSEFTVGGVSGKYLFNGDIYDTDCQNTSEMTITRLDLNAQIISGTFFYDVIDGNGQLREIRDGRFYMRFTQ